MKRHVRPGFRARRWARGALALALTLGACGSDDAAGSGVLAGGGEVVPPWDAYCVATFTADYEFVDAFGDVEARVTAGSRYVISNFGGFSAAATVLYLTDEGPIELGVNEAPGSPLPFSSNCTEDDVTSHVGVFAQVPIYADAELTLLSCTLAEGTVLEGGSFAYALVSGGLFSGGGTYQIQFPGLAGACGGLASGYLRAGSVQQGDTETTVVPIAPVLGPPR